MPRFFSTPIFSRCQAVSIRCCNSDTVGVRTLAGGRFERGRCSMVDQAVEEPTSKDLAVGDFELSRYSEWKQGEGSAILPRCAGFLLALMRTAGSDRFLAVGASLYGGRGFCISPLNSRPIRWHLAAIFLRASSPSMTTNPTSSKGLKRP